MYHLTNYRMSKADWIFTRYFNWPVIRGDFLPNPPPIFFWLLLDFSWKLNVIHIRKEYIHRLNNRENGIFSGFAWIFPGLQDTRYLQWWMGTPLGKRGVARDGLREARQGLCCAVLCAMCCAVRFCTSFSDQCCWWEKRAGRGQRCEKLNGRHNNSIEVGVL